MPNLVEKFRAELGFLWGANPHVTRTQIYPTEDRVKAGQHVHHSTVTLQAK